MGSLDDFDYDLPPEAIAQTPAEPRTAARLLDATDPAGSIRHLTIDAFADLLVPGDLLVVNETRVQPARVHARKPTGASVELLLLESVSGDAERWEALVRPGRKVRDGSVLLVDGRAAVEVGGAAGGRGRRLVRLLDPDAVARAATIALPPYVRRPLEDPERYQTVYARSAGSVAAPTAGLHFTEELLERCRGAGASLATVDLRIGMGTFSPVAEERVEDHRMHAETYRVPGETMRACSEARRVVAVGTTTVRALESAAATGELEGRTSLYISPGYEFRVVDVLLTNFHLPRSSLLIMLEAFCGPRWRDLYRLALAEGYRFLSLGDAMVVARPPRE